MESIIRINFIPRGDCVALNVVHCSVTDRSKMLLFLPGIDGKEIPRKWITYFEDTKTLHCSFCLRYAAEKHHQNPFITGCSDWRHVTVYINRHEDSQCHKNASEAYFINSHGQSVKACLENDQMDLRKKHVLQRRAALACIIDVIFFTAKQGLAFRSAHTERADVVFDDDHLENRGNFLEAVKMLSEHCPDLKTYLDNVTNEGKKRDPSSKGRGSFVSFLSKTTVNKICRIIKEMIQEEIVAEAQEAGMFSVQMDSTQDVSIHDQCAVVIRYVANDVVKESFVRLVEVKDSSGRRLHSLLTESLEEVGLDLGKCVGDSFDGAANMSGQFSGVQALMKEKQPSHIHTWCHAHVLNLVIGDTSSICVSAISLFGMLNELSNFFGESYKRIAVWEEQMSSKTGQAKLKRLEHIGQTRWSSRARALRKIFGNFNDQSSHSSGFYPDLLIILHKVSESPDFSRKVRYDAQKLLENLCKFEIVLTAFTFMRIFEITTPVSDYLQSSGLDVLQAWKMIDDATKRLNGISRDFDRVLDKVKEYVGNLDQQFNVDGHGIIIQQTIQQTRQAARRTNSDVDPEKDYEIKSYNVILDAICSSMTKRFSSHESLCKQLACFDPNRFNELTRNPELIDLSLIREAVPEIDCTSLQQELVSFASVYSDLKKGLFEETLATMAVESLECDDDLTEENVASKACRNCLSCVLKLLCQYRLLSSAYENLYLAYKYLITLSVTQVTCERTFSKLKIIKTRLRSSISQQNLESLMLMSVEKKVTSKVKENKEEILDRFARSSNELSRLLLM